METVKKIIGNQIVETFTRIHNKVNELDRKMQLEIAKDLVLNAGEVDTVLSIGNHPQTNVTELAKINGVSKAAISKMVKKLAEKGFVDRKKIAGNKKEVILELTYLGESVVELRNEHHKDFFEMIESHLSGYSIENVDNFLSVIKIIENHIDEHLH